LPPGAHSVEAAPEEGGAHLVRLNADLQTARRVSATTLEFSYQSKARAIAVFDRAPLRMEMDGAGEPLQFAGPRTILLPRGQHVVTITTE
jgi:hypothetical protein